MVKSRVCNRENLNLNTGHGGGLFVVSMSSSHLSQLLPLQQASGLGGPANRMTKDARVELSKIYKHALGLLAQS